MPARRALRITGAAAYELLRLTHDSSDILPPLKSVAGGALSITDLAVKFRTSKKDWQEFSSYVQSIVASIIDSLSIVDDGRTEIISKLKELESVLNEIMATIKARQRERIGSRLFHFLEHHDVIAELKRKVDDSVDLLKFDLAITTGIKVDKTLEITQYNTQMLSKTTLGATLGKLQYVKGASWDIRRVCLESTRHHLIEEILSWVENADGSRTTNILLLTGVAGAGKTTVAHTVAKHYAGTSQLVTSFFFDREIDGRNSPNHLISTMAVDLCQTNEQLASRIQARIEEDERIAHSPISRQFEDLILQPCKDLPAGRPMVIVLDALDEGYDDDLLWILGEAAKLPRHICFFLTSRAFPELEVLCQKPHIYSVALDIHTQENSRDIALFIPHRLRQVAKHHGLDDGWPDKQLTASFASRAGGLFLWVSTVCDYLCTRSDPTSELEKLVFAPHTSNPSAEAKMDKLYCAILQTCNWDDEAFVNDYHRLMGAVVASRTPLTLDALGGLYERVPVVSNLTLRQLSPLLTGLATDKGILQPVRFLHQSLPDFLILRATSLGSLLGHHKLDISEKTHSQTLALHCLAKMNRDLDSTLSGAGYLADSAYFGIPSVSSEGRISEGLWYACHFWVDHLLDVDLSMSPAVLEQLKEFLGGRLILWMEIIAMYTQYGGISKLRNWLMKQNIEEPTLVSLVFSPSQGSISCALAERLEYMGRREEALTAAKEGVEIYRKLAKDAPSEPCAGLAVSLHILSQQLHKLGYSENALIASEEAVILRRQLATDQPLRFSPHLANSVHSHSIYLSSVGRHQEALKSIEEAVELRQQLSNERPTEFIHNLATSVHQLSSCLYRLGRHDEALKTIEEAVKLHRQLVNEQSATFTPDLAASVHELSVYLSNLGHHEEALQATEEAVKLWRQLVDERPAALTPDLAASVHALSVHLSNLGRHDEALRAIEEAVMLREKLASERPAALTPDLAASIHQLSSCRYRLGHHKEALKTIEEAVRLRRQLANYRPAAFMPHLAASVHERSVYLSSLCRHEEALEAIEEAVKLRRQLAIEQPAMFIPHLAYSVHALSVYLASLGRHEEALKTITEAVELRRHLATERPAAFTPDLAASVHQLSSCLYCLSRHEEALKAIEEAVNLRRQLASARAIAFTPDLVHSVHAFSVYLSCLGHHEEALKATEEAVELRRQLAHEHPATFTGDLATSVHQLSTCFYRLGWHKEALNAAEETVALRRQLAVEQPAVFIPHLAASVHELSVYLSSLCRHGEALEAIEEAVKLRRELASAQPVALTPDLAASVHQLSSCLYRLGFHEKALKTVEEAVKLHRQLASERPPAFTPELAHSVHALSTYLSSLGCHEKALEAMEEAVKLRRQLSSGRPAAFTPDLANSLHTLAINYNTGGFHQKALETIKQSVELYSPFVQKYPAKYGTEYSKALHLLDKYSSIAQADAEALPAGPVLNAATSAWP